MALLTTFFNPPPTLFYACFELFVAQGGNTGVHPDRQRNRSPPLPTREELSDNQVCNWGKMSHFRQK